MGRENEARWRSCEGGVAEACKQGIALGGKALREAESHPVLDAGSP